MRPRAAGFTDCARALAKCLALGIIRRCEPDPRPDCRTVVALARLCCVGLLLLLRGCSEHEPQLSLPPLPPLRDASVAARGRTGRARSRAPTTRIATTASIARATCASQERIAPTPADNSRCSDGVFCNGVEVCDPGMGCRPGSPLRCDDDSVCTIDSCDEDRKALRTHAARLRRRRRGRLALRRRHRLRRLRRHARDGRVRDLRRRHRQRLRRSHRRGRRVQRPTPRHAAMTRWRSAAAAAYMVDLAGAAPTTRSSAACSARAMPHSPSSSTEPQGRDAGRARPVERRHRGDRGARRAQRLRTTSRPRSSAATAFRRWRASARLPPDATSRS